MLFRSASTKSSNPQGGYSSCNELASKSTWDQLAAYLVLITTCGKRIQWTAWNQVVHGYKAQLQRSELSRSCSWTNKSPTQPCFHRFLCDRPIAPFYAIDTIFLLDGLDLRIISRANVQKWSLL